MPQTPREVGYAMPVPQGIARTYPVFKDGLIYWADNDTGLHVAQIHGTPERRAAGSGFGRLRRERDQPASVAIEARSCTDQSGASHFGLRSTLASAPTHTVVSFAVAAQRWSEHLGDHEQPTGDRVGLPDACGLHDGRRGQVSALRHGPGSRRAVRRSRLPARLPHRAAPSSSRDRRRRCASRIFHPGTRRADQEVRGRARDGSITSSSSARTWSTSSTSIRTEQPDGTWSIDVTLPKAGLLQGALGLSAERRRVAVHRAAARDRGYTGDLAADSAHLVPDTSLTKTVDDITATLTYDPPDVRRRAVRPSQFSSDRHRNRPPDHRSADLSRRVRPHADHERGHGRTTSTRIRSTSSRMPDDDGGPPQFLIPPGADLETLRGGPDVTFEGLMPKPGRYRAWTQFRRHDKVYTFAFTFDVVASTAEVTQTMSPRDAGRLMSV